ncbi:MAG: DUF1178 family protein [Variibacter sp.]
MIRYALICDKSHEFESWFQSSDAFAKQAKRKLVTCPVCGSVKVEKALMAPRLKRSDKGKGRDVAPAAQPPGADAVAAPANVPVAIMSNEEKQFRAKLKELRDHLIKNSDNVGKKFAAEARKMHYGEIEHRSIYGEASPDEAKALHEEGIEFHPLPILPDERN